MSKGGLGRKLKEALRPATGKKKTFRMARDFCAFQVFLAALSIWSIANRWITVCAMCILAEFMEARIFMLSLRLRRTEEPAEEKQESKDRK